MFYTINLQKDIHLYEILEMFYPPKGLCDSRTRMGSIWRSFHFIVVWGRVFDTLNLLTEIHLFKCFIPRREVRKHSRWGPIDFLMVYSFTQDRKLKFQFVIWNPPKKFGQKPLSCEWVGRWVGGWVDGDRKGPSIFFIFKYVNKYVVKKFSRLFLSKTFLWVWLLSLKLEVRENYFWN